MKKANLKKLNNRENNSWITKFLRTQSYFEDYNVVVDFYSNLNWSLGGYKQDIVIAFVI